MRVSVTEVPKEASFIREDEVWVQVLANRQPPWGEIQNFLQEHHPELYRQCKPDPVEHLEASFAEDFDYEFEDWYILERTR